MGCQICHSSCTVCRSSSDSSATELRRCPDVLEGKTAVYGSYGTIEILNACGQAVTLVSVDGTVLYNGIGQDNMTIRAAAGIYLVKVADKAYKVTVK